MAREQRKDVDYFPHDCTHGRKMHIIETKYGNDGYATWFKLLEQLGKANNHYIDISDEMTLMFLVSLFKISEEQTLSILTDLSKLGSIDKNLFDNYKVIWSKKFSDSIADAYRNRKGLIFQYSDILSEIQQKKAQSYASLTANEGNLTEVIPKVKESKEEETKVKEKKVIFNFKKSLIDYGFDEDLISEWLVVRKTKQVANTKTAYEDFIKEIESRNCVIDEVLRIIVSNGWAKFKYSWIDNIEKINKNGESKSNSEIVAGVINSQTARDFVAGRTANKG